MKRSLIVSLMIVLMVALISVPLVGKIPRKEHKALLALYYATGGDEWYNRTNWLGKEGTEKDWYGITCNHDNTTVLEINLSSNKLKGPLPPELGDLKNLKSLVLRGNHLTRIPPELSGLKLLQVLDLGKTRLNGQIPSWIGKLSNLTELYLDLNEFTGPIPESLRNLSNLLHLNLYRNRLSGNIPGGLENLSKLITLNLGYNEVTGMIPTRIDRLSNLKELNLSNNKLEGPIPGNLGNLQNLNILKIEKNQLEGQIPQNLALLTQLEDNKSNLKWNALYTKDADLKNFLNEKQEGGDWKSTQTIAPKVIRATPLTQSSIKVKWKPVAYTVDRGGYQVLYSTSKGRYYKVGTTVIGKTETEAMIGGLQSRTTYYFVVKSWTNPHDNNQEDVYSGFSNMVSATTHGTTIFGSVKTETGKPIDGVSIIAYNKDGTINEKSNTAEDGKYNLSVDRGWTGRVKPSKNGFAFRPTEIPYDSPVDGDQKNQNYTGWITTVIEGKVTNRAGDKGIPGVALVFSDTKESEREPAKTETDEDGKYKFTVNYGWTGTVTPQKEGYKFFPKNKPYASEPVTSGREQNFTAYELPAITVNIKGRRKKFKNEVKLKFTGKEGFPSLETETITPVEKGVFVKPIPIKNPSETWSGTVKPEKKGYIFYPSKRSCDEITADSKKEFHYKTELDRKFFIAVTGSQMIPSQGNFDDVYGKRLFSPEIKAGYKFFRDFYVWAGYSFLSKNGKSYPQFKEPSKWEEKFLSLGLGYIDDLSIYFGWKAKLGMVFVSFSEESLGEYVSVTTMGVRIDGAGIFKFTDQLFTEISLGYLLADDTVNTDIGEVKIKLGGMRAGIGLGLRF